MDRKQKPGKDFFQRDGPHINGIRVKFELCVIEVLYMKGFVYFVYLLPCFYVILWVCNLSIISLALCSIILTCFIIFINFCNIPLVGCFQIVEFLYILSDILVRGLTYPSSGTAHQQQWGEPCPVWRPRSCTSWEHTCKKRSTGSNRLRLSWQLFSALCLPHR